MYLSFRPSQAFLLSVLFLFCHAAFIHAQQAGAGSATGADAAAGVAPAGQQVSAQAADTGYIAGTVMDVYNDIVSGATATLDDGTPADSRTATSNDSGIFQFDKIRPGLPYHLTISSKGFVDWTSSQVVIKPGEYFMVQGIQLKLANTDSSVTVVADTAQIATEQVQVEEKQRVFGFIPNYYVVYDTQNVVPMTAKLKFQMAFKTAIDPISFAGSAFLAGVNQVNDTPNYVQGAKGYGQRFGAAYTDGFTDIMFGGAILPAVLHQDPRYYYQGTGTTKSRLMHALAYPFICKGDNGKLQPNFSTIGGDLISASLSNLYYPNSNRGPGLVFTNFGINTAERALSTVLQEFVLRRLTPSAKKQN
jgi:hypothetical protein